MTKHSLNVEEASALAEKLCTHADDLFRAEFAEIGGTAEMRRIENSAREMLIQSGIEPPNFISAAGLRRIACEIQSYAKQRESNEDPPA